MRGNLPKCWRWSRRGRSIPACAGEPCGGEVGRALPEVYPRLCGGTTGAQTVNEYDNGLSPPVRGNPSQRIIAPICERSIPACAGEPAIARIDLSPDEVYPRLCGGTGFRRPGRHIRQGLSPPVRGNLRPDRYFAIGKGSIPACAGEPGCACAGAAFPAVYPRLCGGTSASQLDTAARRGLSPPVRGNLEEYVTGLPASGSIPACAGEPLQASRIAILRTVYPRLCGGTQPPRIAAMVGLGLSPPVRGNRFRF